MKKNLYLYIKTTVGEVLEEEFLIPLKLSQNEFAKRLKVPSNRINEIVRGKRKITPETDFLMCTYFGLSLGYFLRMQTDLEIKEEIRIAETSKVKILTHKDFEKKTEKRLAST